MTRSESPRALLELRYAQDAQAYLQSLPLEHFMESTSQATQRKITVESLDLLMARRSDVHVFSELLVQYPKPRRKHLGKVVPDNMIVIHKAPIIADGSYAMALQPARPFWVLEYVSKSNKRKDYKDNMRKYEHELQVPYYLLFQPDKEKLTLYHHNGKRYVAVRPNLAGRLALAELDLEMALLDGWVRFWHKCELLPLPAELQRQRDEAEQKLDAAKRELAELREEIRKMRTKPNGTH